MGVSSLVNRIAYTCDGSSTVFAFPYDFFNNTDLNVYTFSTGSGTIAPQLLNTNFTVSGTQSNGIYPNGANVIMNSAMPVGFELIITRAPLPIQNFQLYQNQPISSVGLVQQLDYLTLLTQRIQDQLQNCIQLPDGVGPVNNISFSSVLPVGAMMPFYGGSPLILNSGATGWSFGLVANGQSGAVSYMGVLPVPFGGTGQNLPLSQYAAVFAMNSAQMGTSNFVWFDTTNGRVVLGSSALGTWPVWLSDFYGGGASGAKGGPLRVGSAGNIFVGSTAIDGSDISGILPVSNGGLGIGSILPQFGLLYASSATSAAIVPSAAAGWLLTANGSAAPSFQQLGATAISSGVLAIANGGTGVPILSPQWGLPYMSSITQMGVVAPATAGTVLTANASSAPTFQAVGTLPYIAQSSAGTAAYGNWYFLTGSSFNVTMPDANGNNGQALLLQHAGVNLIQAYTIVTSGAQTVNGIASGSYTLYTKGEKLALRSDGSNFQVTQHDTHTGETSAGPLALLGTTTNPSKPTTIYDNFYWARNGRYCEYRYEYKQTVTTGSAGSGDYYLVLPTGITIDTSFILCNSAAIGASYPSRSGTGSYSIIGNGYCDQVSGATSAVCQMYPKDSTAMKVLWAGNGVWASSVEPLNDAMVMAISGKFPVPGWQP